jgi:2-oxoglutarate ferredoxin oxidoreductase subunit gamma
MMKINVRFAGAGGQGVILAAVELAEAYALREDYNISQTQSYGPEARGGACKAEVVISDEEIDYMKVDDADVFVALNQAGFNKYLSRSKKNAMVLINSTLVESKDPTHYLIPATEIAEKLQNPRGVNMVMLGALTKLLPKIHYPSVEEQIKERFEGKLADLNLQAYQAGYEYMATLLAQPKSVMN